MNTEELCQDNDINGNVAYDSVEDIQLSASENESLQHAAATSEKRSSIPGSDTTEKKRRYRNLFGNIGKLITLRRRKSNQEQSSDTEDSKNPVSPDDKKSVDSVSLDLVVPEHSETEQNIDTKKMEHDIADEKTEIDDNEDGNTASIKSEDNNLVATNIIDKKDSEPNLIQLNSEINLAEIEPKTTTDHADSENSENQEETKIEENDLTDAKESNETEAEVAEVTNRQVESLISESDSGYDGSSSHSPSHAEDNSDQDKKLHVLDPSVKEEDETTEERSSSNSVFNDDEQTCEERESGDGQETKDSEPKTHQDVEVDVECEELKSFEKAEKILLNSNANLHDIEVKFESLMPNSSDKEYNADTNSTGLVNSSNTDQITHIIDNLEATAEQTEIGEHQDHTNITLNSQDQEKLPAKPTEHESETTKTVCEEVKESKHEEDIENPVSKLTETESSIQEPIKIQDKPNTTSNIEDKSSISVIEEEVVVVDSVISQEIGQHMSDINTETDRHGRTRSRLPVRRSSSLQRSVSPRQPSPNIAKPYTPVKIDLTVPLQRKDEDLAQQLPSSTDDRYASSSQENKNKSNHDHSAHASDKNRKKKSKKVHFGPAAGDQILRYSPSQSPEESSAMNGLNGSSGFAEPQSQIKKYIENNDKSPKGRRSSDCNEQKSTSNTDKTSLKNITVKQTLASRKRLEHLHDEAVRQLEMQDDSIYMTPLQRKDVEVKELRRQLDEACFIIEQRELELDVFHHEKNKSIEEAIQSRDERISGLHVQIQNLESDLQSLRTAHAELQRRRDDLQSTVEQMKLDMEQRERKHQDLYLEMYRKGQNSAKFERQDEIEKLAVLEPDKVALEELIEKLETTQQDLQKWQSVKLQGSYAENEREVTEAEAKIRFLRDSMYHYLTEKDRYHVAQHMTAIIGIFSFTDVQMKNIMKALDEKKKKGLL